MKLLAVLVLVAVGVHHAAAEEAGGDAPDFSKMRVKELKKLLKVRPPRTPRHHAWSRPSAIHPSLACAATAGWGRWRGQQQAKERAPHRELIAVGSGSGSGALPPRRSAGWTHGATGRRLTS